LTGSIPSELGALKYLKKIYMNSTGNFTCIIPSELGRLTNTQAISLANNGLISPLPSTIGTMTSLKLLDFSHNEIFGTMPYQLGSLRNLIKADPSANEITGSIPTELGLLSSLGFASAGLILEETNLTGTVPLELCRLRNSTGFSFSLDCTDVSCGCCDDFC